MPDHSKAEARLEKQQLALEKKALAQQKKIADREKKSIAKQNKAKKKAKEKERKLAAKIKKQEKAHALKLQKKDPAWQAQQRTKKMQEKMQEKQKNIVARQKKSKEKQIKKHERSKLKALKKDPAWQLKEREKRNKEKMEALQKKQALQAKKALTKEKSKTQKRIKKEKEQAKKALAKQKALAQKAELKELKQDPEWVAVQQEKDFQEKEQAIAKKLKQKELKAKQNEKKREKKAILKQKKALQRAKKKGLAFDEEGALVVKPARSFSFSPSFSPKLKIVGMVLVAMVALGGSFAGAYWFMTASPTPEKVTERYLQAFQKNDQDAMVKYCASKYDFISDKIMTEPSYAQVKTVMEEKVHDIDYEILSVEALEDTAIVEVKIIGYDLGTVIAADVEKNFNDNYVPLVAGQITQEEMEQRLIASLETNLPPIEKTYEQVVKINLTQVDKKWQIGDLTETNPTLAKCLTGSL